MYAPGPLDKFGARNFVTVSSVSSTYLGRGKYDITNYLWGT